MNLLNSDVLIVCTPSVTDCEEQVRYSLTLTILVDLVISVDHTHCYGLVLIKFIGCCMHRQLKDTV